MSIITCYECSGKISNKADICPDCGAPSKNIKRKNYPVLGVLLILFGGLVVFGITIPGEGETTSSFSEDLIGLLLIGLLPIYFGFKLYNQTDLLIIFNNWLKTLFRR
jgi:uncharacterized membrane protein